MTATPSDFIGASGFTVRDDVAVGATRLSIHGSSTAVPSPSVITAGQRIKVTSGATTDYYRITASVAGTLVTGVSLNWVDCVITPSATHAHTAGDKLEFEPYASNILQIPTQDTKIGLGHSLDLTKYFTMIGGKSSDLTFVARPGGAFAQVSVSHTSLAISGNSAGTMSVTVTAFDRARGRITQTFSIVVGLANRPPASRKAIGNPTIGVGESRTYDLDDYFRDPDGDPLSYVTTGIDRKVATVRQPGSDLVITGVAKGDVTMRVEATDQYLTISQQVHVRVPANRRPIRTDHVLPVALAEFGRTVLRPIDKAFRDPDGGVLKWYFQWEEGDTTHQFRQEVWNVYRVQGTSMLNCRSLFQYPEGDKEPWGSGNAWIVPTNTDISLRTALSTNTAVVNTYRFKTRSAVTVRWSQSERRVYVDIPTATGLPVSTSPLVTLAPPMRMLLGAGADVAWVEGDQQAPMNFVPGDSFGSRTGYVRVWDAGKPPLDASDLFNVALGRAPIIATPIDDFSVFTGSTTPIPLGIHFRDPDGDSLSYAVSQSKDHYFQLNIVGDELRLYAQLVGNVAVTVVATDAIGLTANTTFNVEIEESKVHARTPIMTGKRAAQVINNRGEWIELDFDGSLIKMKAIVVATAPATSSTDRAEFQTAFPEEYSVVIPDVTLHRLLSQSQRTAITEFNLNVSSEILAEKNLPSITVRNQVRYPIAVYRAIESDVSLYWRVNLTQARLSTSQQAGWAVVNNVALAITRGPDVTGPLGRDYGNRFYITVDIHPFLGTDLVPRQDTMSWQIAIGTDSRGNVIVVPFNRPNWLLPTSIFKRTAISNDDSRLRSANDQDALRFWTWQPDFGGWNDFFTAAGYEIRRKDGIWQRVLWAEENAWGVKDGAEFQPLLQAGYLRNVRPALPGKANQRIFRMTHFINREEWENLTFSDITVAPSPNVRFIDASGNVLTDAIQYINRDARDSDDYLIDEAGNRLPDIAVRPVVTFAPRPPGTLTLVEGDEEFTASWTVPRYIGGTPITGYQLQYRLSGATAWIDELLTSTTLIVKSLTAGTYDVRVAAKNKEGLSVYTPAEPVVVHRSGPSVPGVPTGLTVVGSGNLLVATWVEPADDGGSRITSYQVEYRAGSSGGWTKWTIVVWPIVTATVTGLSAGLHQARVAAINAQGTSAYTTEVDATVTTATVPGIPQNFAVTDGPGRFRASWSAPADDGGSPVTGYTLSYFGGRVSTTTIDTIFTSRTITAPSGAYGVKVAARNTVGRGSYTAQLTARVT